MGERQPPYSGKRLADCAEEHLRHELVQGTATAILLARGDLTIGMLNVSEEVARRAASWVSNALLESFLLHARTVDDFLSHDHPAQLRPGQHDDDVLAVDYLPTWKPRRALLKADRRDVNRQLAHLSIHRRSGAARPWEFVAISARLLSSLARFLSQFRDAQPQDRRITDTRSLEVGWQQSMQMLTDFGFHSDGRSPREGGTANPSSSTSSSP